MNPLLTSSLKIASGEILAKEVAGESGDWANKQQWTARIRNNQGNLHIKTPSIASKFILQKISDNPSLNSVHQYTNQSAIQPLITPTLRSASGQGERPGGSPGPRTLRRSSTTGWNNFTWLTWSEKCDTIILSKSANPSRSRRKNLSRNEESNDTTNKNRLCRRLADTRDLKSLSGDRVRVRPRRQY